MPHSESEVRMTDKQIIIDFMLKDSGQFTVEGHYYIYSKSVYAGGKTFEEALVNWWNKYCEKSKMPEYQQIKNRPISKAVEQF